MPADLITLDYLLANQDEDETEISQDDTSQYEAGITAASAIVRNYTGRLFELSTDAAQGPRTYRLGEGGLLEIDDCTAINSVTVTNAPQTFSRTLQASEYFGMDINEPTMSYIELYTVTPFYFGSPAMGFKWNADTMDQVWAYPVLIQVDANWGWPEIPVEVQLATALTVQFILDPNTNNGISSSVSQSIATYSTSTNYRSATTLLPEAPLPIKAQAILDKYNKYNV